MHALIECPQCQTKARVPEEHLGKKVRCPACQNIYEAAIVAEVVEEVPSSSTQIQTNPAPPPSPPGFSVGQMEPDDYADDFEPRAWTPFPGVVRAAGIIWITFGGLIVFAFLFAMFALALRSRRGGQLGELMGVLFCGGSLIAIFAGGFIFVGVQTVRGTAKDMLGNGIGSIIFACIIGLIGVAGLLRARGDPGGQAVLGGVVLLEVIGLLLGGILALIGRSDYRAWRRENRPPKAGQDQHWRRLDEPA